jgi:hypothetical protein
MGTGYIHPSMARVTLLSEDFLKKAHKIMRDKGYKLDSGVASAEATWSYSKPGSPDVYMSGWHGRKPREWGAGKTVWGINVWGSHNTFMNDDCHMLSCMDIEWSLGHRYNMLPEEKIKQYEENLKKGLAFLENIESYIVMIAMTS